MGLLNIFRHRQLEVDVYQQELTELTKNITTFQSQLTALQAKSKSYRNIILMVLVPVYVLWLWFKLQWSLPARHKAELPIFIRHFSHLSFDDILAMVIFPTSLVLSLYLLHVGFSFLINNRNKKLLATKRKQKEKIEEFKEKTNYNAANQLLAKFGNPDSEAQDIQKPRTQIKYRNPPNAPKASQSTGIKNENFPKKAGVQLRGKPTAVNPILQLSYPASTSVAKQNGKRTMQDRLLDFIIGSDNNEAVEARYALICSSCFVHNGLAPPGCIDPSRIPFVCRKCGALNNVPTNLKTPGASQKLEQESSTPQLNLQPAPLNQEEIIID